MVHYTAMDPLLEWFVQTICESQLVARSHIVDDLLVVAHSRILGAISSSGSLVCLGVLLITVSLLVFASSQEWITQSTWTSSILVHFSPLVVKGLWFTFSA